MKYVSLNSCFSGEALRGSPLLCFAIILYVEIGKWEQKNTSGGAIGYHMTGLGTYLICLHKRDSVALLHEFTWRSKQEGILA
jgi:hypothetical protein